MRLATVSVTFSSETRLGDTMIEKLIVGRFIVLQVPPIGVTAPLAGVAGFLVQPAIFLTLEESQKVRGVGKVSDVAQGVGAKAHRNFRFLYWLPGSVSCCRMMGADVMTGPMSGCTLTRFTRGGWTYAGHLGTDTDSVANTTAAKNAWNNFANANPGDVLGGFNPLITLASKMLTNHPPLAYCTQGCRK